MIGAENAFDKVQNAFRIKILEALGMDGAYLKIIKEIYNKATPTL